MNFFKKIAEGLTKTKENLVSNVENVIASFVKIDDELFEELEDTLIMSDIGVETATHIIATTKRRVQHENLTDGQQVYRVIKEEITHILTGAPELPPVPTEPVEELLYQPAAPVEVPIGLAPYGPTVILVVGVNGVGKTTTIGKLTSYYQSRGKKVLLAAGDTFRAAAIDQLQIWADRNQVDMIRHKENADPSAVIFDAANAAKARRADVLIADTAGRLHNKKNLMEELKKIKKVVNRAFENAHIETFLVLDANTGQNAVLQAQAFTEATEVTGIVLTKLDSTAKGGIVVAIKHTLGIPIVFAGVGEGIEDLIPFDSAAFAQALFE